MRLTIKAERTPDCSGIGAGDVIAFKGEINYAQIIKVYGADPAEDQRH
jgi:hypothetical protein